MLRSRVTPGSLATSARRERVSRLKRVDFPVFGRPTNAMTGSRDRSSAIGRAWSQPPRGPNPPPGPARRGAPDRREPDDPRGRELRRGLDSPFAPLGATFFAPPTRFFAPDFFEAEALVVTLFVLALFCTRLRRSALLAASLLGAGRLLCPAPLPRATRLRATPAFGAGIHRITSRRD